MNKYKLTILLENGTSQNLLVLSDEEDTAKVKQMLLQQFGSASLSSSFIVLTDAETNEDVALKGTAIVGYRVKHAGKVTSGE
ncbi:MULTISPECIES: hypothetical protein [Bacillus cereus group]|uniref:hypothetical protein n=1 Tax=Bacillus cereus group TaxID=86661 RepID=UPI00288CAD16|nr:hypothetical protein [Bacillus cereus]MED2683995.1 hypothetical protein [Bacillus thuringiensis]HDX9563591.1 hypothetical protein [Bacillus thuringiensis]HDX9701744.1 hypothetical protein [Bacillus thuringiensis]